MMAPESFSLDFDPCEKTKNGQITIPEHTRSDGLNALGLHPHKTVMRTCCGCASTKAGSQTILMAYCLLCMMMVILSSVYVGNGKFQDWVSTDVEGGHECKAGDYADEWWCDAVVDLKTGVNRMLIANIVLSILLFFVSAVGLYGASKAKHLLLLPWLIFDFILLTFVTIFMMTVILIMSVYVKPSGNSSSTTTVAVLSMICLVFLFYIWLCVLSYYQVLKEVAKLGLGNMENVFPFVNEPESSVYGEQDQQLQSLEPYENSPVDTVESPDNKEDNDDDNDFFTGNHFNMDSRASTAKSRASMNPSRASTAAKSRTSTAKSRTSMNESRSSTAKSRARSAGSGSSRMGTPKLNDLPDVEQYT